MLCGGHSAKSHYTQLKSLASKKKFGTEMLKGFGELVEKAGWKFGELQKIFCQPSKDDVSSRLSSLVCHCKGRHTGRNCGCLREGFIFSARAKYIATLTDAGTDPDKFSARLAMLYHHALNEHEWDGGRCDFHSLIVCSCGQCI